MGNLNYRNDMWMTNPGCYTLQVTSLVASKSMILDSLIAIRIRKCVQLFFEKHSRAASTLVPNIPRLGVWSIRCYDYPASMLQFTETHLADGFPGKWFFYFKCFPKLSLFGLTILVGHSDVRDMSHTSTIFGFYPVVVLWCTNKLRFRCTRHVCCL